MSRLAPANRRPTTSLRPPLRKGKIGRQDVLFEEKNHIFFQNIIIFGFLQGNPTESILWGVQTSLKPTENIPTWDVSAWRTTARRQVCWQGRADCSMVPQLLDVEMGHVISGRAWNWGYIPKLLFLREIWWLYEWPLDFGVSCFQTKPICLSAFRHVFPCP